LSRIQTLTTIEVVDLVMVDEYESMRTTRRGKINLGEGLDRGAGHNLMRCNEFDFWHLQSTCCYLTGGSHIDRNQHTQGGMLLYIHMVDISNASIIWQR